jgi:hypothetical protein
MAFFCLIPGLSVLPVFRFVPPEGGCRSHQVDAQGEQPDRSIHHPDLRQPKRLPHRLELLKTCRLRRALDPESYPLQCGFHTMSNLQAVLVLAFCMLKAQVPPSKQRREVKVSLSSVLNKNVIDMTGIVLYSKKFPFNRNLLVLETSVRAIDFD